jgi:hypothetical protein
MRYPSRKLFLSLLFLSLYAGAVVFATPPGSQYTPGETLDPSCAPGDTNCSVLLSSGWGLTGNAGTDPSINYIGTSDNQDVVIRRNGNTRIRIYENKIAMGNGAGVGTASADYSNFFGFDAGRNATNASYSNFTGYNAGKNAVSAINSNFFGYNAGNGATTANDSIFVGTFSGSNAVNAAQSVFIGENAGEDATDAFASVFMGSAAGMSATNASFSTLIGLRAGASFTGNNIGSNNIIIGTDISLPNGATNSMNIGGVLFGAELNQNTGFNPSITPVSGGRIGIGVVSPVATLDINGDTIISGSSRYLNFGTTSGTSGYGFRDNSGTLEYKNNAGSWSGIGGWGLTGNAGTNSTTNFIGTTDDVNVVVRRNNLVAATFFGNPIRMVLGTAGTTFIGSGAGTDSAGTGPATGATNAILIGNNAGRGSTNASNSVSIGSSASTNGSQNSQSVHIGSAAGAQPFGTQTESTMVGGSSGYGGGGNRTNFFGYYSGIFATGATNSTFIGYQAGAGTSNSTNSIFIGYNTGSFYNPNKTGSLGSNNIIIGTNVSLPNSTTNSMNLGGVLFGTGTYATTSGNPSIAAVTTGKIGIATIPTTYTLEVGNSSVAGIVSRFTNSTGTCDINPTTTSLVCSSDETLKSNITSLDSSLTSLSALRPVTYSWNTDDTNAPQVGFIAQEVESIFPNLVFTDPTTGLKSLAYTNLIPYTVKAIQDMNISLTTLEDVEKENPFRDAIVRLLESATNGIQRIFVKELNSEKVQTQELCLDDVCVTKEQLQYLLQVLPPATPEEPSAAQDYNPPAEESSLEEIAPEPEIPMEETILEPETQETEPIA